LKDPDLTTEPTPNEIAADAPVTVTFKELGLDPKIIKALDDMGYEKPTPIQANAIPAALAGKDVLGIAQTGTGKTGAFTLPTVHKLAKGRARARMPRCLIVCPTRELAAQVAENVELYGKYLKLEMALLIGGVSFAEQDKKLTRGVDVLIATPGRLLDQFERGKILLTGVQTLVVDEADRMLDMGFIPDIERIFEITPFTRQVLFFSATMPNEIKRLVQQFLHQPETIQVARKNMTAKTVTQRIVRLPKSDAKLKRTALRWIIDNENVDNGIVFCNRKRDVDIVAKSLNKHGHSAAPIHGDLAQSQRTETLADFKEGRVKILVASDVAARGLDVPSVSHVFNYDVPSHAEDYVHRRNEKGGKGRGRGDRNRGGGRDRNRSRGNSGGETRNRPAPKREEPVAEVVERKAPEGRKKADAKAEPQTKVVDEAPARREETKQTPKKSSRKASPDRSKKSDDKPRKTKSEEPRRRAKSPEDIARDNAKRNERDNSKRSGKRHHDKGHKENFSGFGDDVPAFFKAQLKK